MTTPDMKTTLKQPMQSSSRSQSSSISPNFPIYSIYYYTSNNKTLHTLGSAEVHLKPVVSTLFRILNSKFMHDIAHAS